MAKKSVAYSRTYATSLRKGLRILGLFSRERPEWRVGEISAAIGSTKSTVSRIAHTLEVEKFLTRTGKRDAYRLALRLWELGSLVITDAADFSGHARSHLQQIVAALGETAHAAIFDDTEIVYVDRLDAPQPLRTSMPLGARFPSYCTATGRAILAFQPDAVVDHVLSQKLKAHSNRTIIRPEALRAELEKTRKRGCAITKGEWRDDIGGVAAPVFDRFSRVVGAIGATMPLSHLTHEKSSRAATVVAQEARAFSSELGFIEHTAARISGRTAKA